MGDLALGILLDDDHVDHPDDVPVHQVQDRGQDLALELVAFELECHKINRTVCHCHLYSLQLGLILS